MGVIADLKLTWFSLGRVFLSCSFSPVPDPCVSELLGDHCLKWAAVCFIFYFKLFLWFFGPLVGFSFFGLALVSLISPSALTILACRLTKVVFPVEYCDTQHSSTHTHTHTNVNSIICNQSSYTDKPLLTTPMHITFIDNYRPTGNILYDDFMLGQEQLWWNLI